MNPLSVLKMGAKRKSCFCLICFLLLLSQAPAVMAITTDELADICERMESAITDISLEYEWYNIPPWTIEEAEAEMGTPMLITKNGLRRFKFSAAGLLSNREPNDPNSAFPDRLLLEESSTIMDKDGNTWDSITKASYDGKIAKYLQIGGWPREIREGGISRSKRFFILPPNLTPLGFSILRLSYDFEKEPLSARLKHKEFVHLDNTIQKINEFNTIRADFLTTSTNKMIYLRVYFSVHHGYTPVRYEYMRGGPPESNLVAFTVEVGSLEQVAKGLWFPSSGRISTSDSERVDAYKVTSKIVVNQGLADKHFDIEFPAGTKVCDNIKNVEYVVKPK